MPSVAPPPSRPVPVCCTEMECGEGMEYALCGSPCQPTCTRVLYRDGVWGGDGVCPLWLPLPADLYPCVVQRWSVGRGWRMPSVAAPVSRPVPVCCTEMECGEGMEYALCGSPCQPTCLAPVASLSCAAVCMEMCVCKAGLVLDGTRCVAAHKCGCEEHGYYYQVRRFNLQRFKLNRIKERIKS